MGHFGQDAPPGKLFQRGGQQTAIRADGQQFIPDLKEALYFIGRSYQGKNEATWAKNFYSKILNLASEDEPVAIKTRKALKELEGAKA